MNEFPFNITAAIQRLRQKLEGIYPPGEATALSRMLVEFVTKKKYFNILLDRSSAFTSEQYSLFSSAAQHLIKGEPIQYILQHAWFRDQEYRVTPAVLIPRGETEELVEWILETCALSPGSKVLDIGTGSGCIGISLALEGNDWEVTATDVSEDALEIARENGILLQAGVRFRQHDLLQWKASDFEGLDLIVSNPPYILKVEQSEMHANVLEHEPHLALFVPDDSPLLYYKAITAAALRWLKPGGWLYFEINEALGKEMVSMMEEAGFREVELKQDLHGKNRMIRGLKFPRPS